MPMISSSLIPQASRKPWLPFPPDIEMIDDSGFRSDGALRKKHLQNRQNSLPRRLLSPSPHIRKPHVQTELLVLASLQPSLIRRRALMPRRSSQRPQGKMLSHGHGSNDDNLRHENPPPLPVTSRRKDEDKGIGRITQKIHRQRPPHLMALSIPSIRRSKYVVPPLRCPPTNKPDKTPEDAAGYPRQSSPRNTCNPASTHTTTLRTLPVSPLAVSGATTVVGSAASGSDARPGDTEPWSSGVRTEAGPMTSLIGGFSTAEEFEQGEISFYS
ncbi:hypothetical protein CDD80_5245 [Ophiocordyceps camponoti-rufipedis]|uniref:Uncharacterized protein n=1 Tax=Ophiocordyceps camponoti-rufipedis TaxID=2004952 RepID=A0A2C5XGE4_9HYPO|nr:hypothetical protein CDD80_5245 [Ophiocordyceps camponoti-rufipedis]